jgi:hypothetical protein
LLIRAAFRTDPGVARHFCTAVRTNIRRHDKCGVWNSECGFLQAGAPFIPHSALRTPHSVHPPTPAYSSSVFSSSSIKM